MNSGQTLLTLFALALLTTITVNIIRSSYSNGATILRAKCGLAAISIATSLIEEAQGKCFDEATAHDSAVNNINSLTAVTSLGKNTGEVYPAFDDFDDFNNFSTTYFLSLPDTFFVNCSVVYINPTTPGVTSTSKTWHKKLNVKVTSPSLKDTVKMDYIFSYWYFR